MADALARMWARFLPEIMQRLRLVEEASQALTCGALTDETRAAAHAAAHKLAGSLGTFGLHRGTSLARQAELLLAELPSSTDDATALAGWVFELRELVIKHNA